MSIYNELERVLNALKKTVIHNVGLSHIYQCNVAVALSAINKMHEIELLLKGEIRELSDE